MISFSRVTSWTLLVSVITLVALSCTFESCKALVAGGGQGRKQSQGVSTRWVGGSSSIATATPTDEEKQLTEKELEALWWSMAGKTSRKKRQRGRKPSAQLREDDPVITATVRVPSTANTNQTNKEYRPVKLEGEIGDEDIQDITVNAPSIDELLGRALTTPDAGGDEQEIHATVSLTNGTIYQVSPQNFHQRRDNAIWMATRKELDVTASELSGIVGNSVFTTREKLLNIKAGVEEKVFTGNLKACEWGLKMEPKALRQYRLVSGNEVEETGLHIQAHVVARNSARTDVMLLLGASPDGLVVDAKDGTRGLLEIKSLWGRRNKKELPQFDHCPQRFYDQIQGQLAVCDREWCDLMLYIPPKLRNRKNYCILRVDRDRSYWSDTLLPSVETFCAEVRALGGSVDEISTSLGG